MFLFYRQRRDGTVGTDIAAYGTVEITESFFETDRWLHHTSQTVFHESGFQYMRRAFADTKMA